MSNSEKKFEILNFIILLGLIAAGCITGKAVMNKVSNTILGFNIPAIGILVVGELVWIKIRRKLQERLNNFEEN